MELLVVLMILIFNAFQVVEGQYFISPAAALVLLSGAMVREVPMMVANGPETLATIRAEWPGFALSIALGTSINYLQFMLIQVKVFISVVGKYTFFPLNTTVCSFLGTLISEPITGARRRGFKSDVHCT
jgi:hypothetical protein